MAISPRTIIRNPALLALTTLAAGAVGVVGVTMMCGSACPASDIDYQRTVEYRQADSPCAAVAVADSNQWTEMDFIRVVYCHDTAGDQEAALLNAKVGLLRYPSSETLLNVRGYQEIELGLYGDAVDTLRNGVARVTPTDGVMENNLAWSGLWAPRKMDLREARKHISNSLTRDPNSCEALHTGMWVEYAVAASQTNVEREHAIARFDVLRDRYFGCEARLNEGKPEVVQEVLGAATMDFEMSRLAPNSRVKPAWARAHTSGTLAKMAMQTARTNGFDDAEFLCNAATPIAQTHNTCLRLTEKKPCRR